MDFTKLQKEIVNIHKELQGKAKSAINMSLTMRNWFIGFFILEYEQNGEDRAKYGESLLVQLSKNLKKKGLKNINEAELRRFRLFYVNYPQFSEKFISTYKKEIRGTVSHELTSNPIRGTLSHELKDYETIVKLQLPAEKLIHSLSYSHFVELIKVKDILKQKFYEVECIKGIWSVRELKRQISTLYFERSGLSKNKEKLRNLVNEKAEVETEISQICNPMIFEFLDLPTNETIEETVLQKTLMDNLQQFLIELGDGFCFEARQKRILIDDEYFFIDLVFYHRILKCHVLVELKTEKFTHENVGQLEVYLQYYKEKMMQEGDNNPIGILLCTEAKPQMVRYTTINKPNITISQYKLKLPSEEELQNFIEENLK